VFTKRAGTDGHGYGLPPFCCCLQSLLDVYGEPSCMEIGNYFFSILLVGCGVGVLVLVSGCISII
jgi:hypothetical protein